MKNSTDNNYDKVAVLAQFLTDKPALEIQELSRSNPQLIEEWIKELEDCRSKARDIEYKLGKSIEHIMIAARPFESIAAE